MTVFLVALAHSACTELHSETVITVGGGESYIKWCDEYSFKGSECAAPVASQMDLKKRFGEKFFNFEDGLCPTVSTGYYCCDPNIKTHYGDPNIQFMKKLDCVEQHCMYEDDAKFAAEKEKEGYKCVEVSTGLSPSNKMDCNAPNPTFAPTTSKPSFSSGTIKDFSDEQCTLVTTLLLLGLPDIASKKGGNCDALKEMMRNSITFGENAKPNIEYSKDEQSKAKCDCFSVLSEEDVKPYNCVSGGENLAKKLISEFSECVAGDGVIHLFDTLFGFFPEGGKLWLFVTVSVAVFLLIICLFICCASRRRSK
jgi:hypothetical protein